VGPGETAFNEAGVNGIEDFLDTDDRACGQDLELDFAIGQGFDVLGEILKHDHFVGRVGDDRLDPDLRRRISRHAEQRRGRQQCDGCDTLG
jgi:hypothetical protein